MRDIIDRAKEMPSSLNDACRTIETMAGEIASLRAQLEGCKEMFVHTAERANEYVKAFQKQEGKLAIEQDALRSCQESWHRVMNNKLAVDKQIASARKALTQIEQISDFCISAEHYTAEDALNHLQGIRNVIKKFSLSDETANEVSCRCGVSERQAVS